MWCMNFIERQGMVRFFLFNTWCMNYCQKYTGCLIFYLKKKIVGKTREVSYSPVFSFGKWFPGFPFNWSRAKEIKNRSCFFLFRFDWTEARITIHVLNILVLKQCCIKFTLDGCVTLSLLFYCCLFVWFLFSTLNTWKSVCIFSILFSMHFLRCWQGEFV